MTQRGSSKVGPMEDEQRQHEEQPFLDGAPVEERSQFRRRETAGPGEPDTDPGRRPLTAEPGPDGQSIDDRNRRADFARWTQPSWFPLDAASLSERLRNQTAPRWIVERVDQLDPATVLASPGAAWDRTRS